MKGKRHDPDAAFAARCEVPERKIRKNTQALMDEKNKCFRIYMETVKALNEVMGDNIEWTRLKRFIASCFDVEPKLAWLALLPYAEYLQTEHWKETRLKAMERAMFSCQVCNQRDVELHTHHRTYERLGHERNEDLIVLCAECHDLFHKNRKLAETQP